MFNEICMFKQRWNLKWIYKSYSEDKTQIFATLIYHTKLHTIYERENVDNEKCVQRNRALNKQNSQDRIKLQTKHKDKIHSTIHTHHIEQSNPD